jgi:hypothetical protein
VDFDGTFPDGSQPYSDGSALNKDQFKVVGHAEAEAINRKVDQAHGCFKQGNRWAIARHKLDHMALADWVVHGRGTRL